MPRVPLLIQNLIDAGELLGTLGDKAKEGGGVRANRRDVVWGAARMVLRCSSFHHRR